MGAAITICIQTQGSEELLHLSIEELLEIKVNGPTLTFEDIHLSPAAVSVYTYEETKRMGLDSLDELMNITAGFQTFRSSNSSIQDLYATRGRRVSGTGSELLMLVDGQRIDDPRTSGSNVMVPKFSLEQIDRVEFIRGPGSAIYGSNAMMGVINIITSTNRNEVGFSIGSNNRKKAHLNYSDFVNGLKISFFANSDSDDGQKYQLPDTFSQSEIKTTDPRESTDFNLKLSFKKTEINLQRYEFKTNDFYESGFLSDGRNQRSAEIDTLSIKQHFDGEVLSSYLWFSYHQTHSSATVQVSPPGMFYVISEPQSDEPMIMDFKSPRYDEVRFQWHNDWTLNANNYIQFGAEYRNLQAPDYLTGTNYKMMDVLTNKTPVKYMQNSLDKTVVQEASNRKILGVYAQYQYEYQDEIHVTLGARYDDFNELGSELSPRIAVVKSFDENCTFKLLFGRAFRAPTESELYMKNNPVFLGNQNLEPEIVDTYEAIWSGKFKHLNLSVGYFENHFQNSIIQGNIGNGLIQFNNFDDGRSNGLEVELFYQISDNLLIRGNHTHIIKTPKLSITEANDMTSVILNYQKNKTNFNLIATRISERSLPTPEDGSDSFKLAAYWELYGKISYYPSNKWELFIQAKNLLDHDIETPPITNTIRHGIPNRGREMLMGGTLKF